MGGSVKIAVYVALIVICGCSSERLVKPYELEKYESMSSYHNLWYMGSDDGYHYFLRLDKVEEKFKVKRSELIWEKEVPLGDVKQYMLVLPGAIRKGV